MGGYDDVVKRQKASQNIVVDHDIGMVFVEIVAFFFIYIKPRRTDFFIFQSVD